MKKVVLFIAVLAIVSCKNEPKDYVTFSGKITDKNSDSIVIKKGDYSKTIAVNEDGTFSDTLKVTPDTYTLFDGGEYGYLFLKNGFDIHMTLDTKRFDQTIQFTGPGSEHSNFIADRLRMNEKLFNLDELISLDSVQRVEKFASISKEMNDFYASHPEVDTSITNSGAKNIERTINSYDSYIGRVQALKREMPKGSISPTFEAYENFNGEKTSLADLKGKYVYVDVWATWCGPCKVEIPHLQVVEEKYHGKNIEFVSISVDDPKRNGSWEKANDNWRKMVEEKELGGIQLFAPQGFQSEFIKDYKINGIPRFILIDPEGNIVDASAPRPSSKELINLFNEENI